MKWRRKIQFKKSEAKALGVIVTWVLLYFNIYRFTAIQTIGNGVPLTFKLISFIVFLAAVLFTVNGIYRGILIGKSKMFSPVWFLIDFLLSITFAVICADHLILFRVLSLLIFVCDRLLYHLVYSKKINA